MRISSSSSSSVRTSARLAGRGEAEAGAGGPMPTVCAPSAMAFTTSVPRMKPPSTMIVARPPTAFTTSGSTSIEPRPWSSWRPPWLET